MKRRVARGVYKTQSSAAAGYLIEGPGAPSSACSPHQYNSGRGEHCAYRVQQRRSHVLPVAIPQARPTKLSSHPAAALVPTHRLGVNGLLSTLVASVTLRRKAVGGEHGIWRGRPTRPHGYPKCTKQPCLSPRIEQCCFSGTNTGTLWQPVSTFSSGAREAS